MASRGELFAEARKCMVDSQIRPNRVNDPAILSAMRRLPREKFLPNQLASLAYVDEDVPLGSGRYMMEPMVLARLLQAASPHAGERVLVVAAGTGYGAAVLAACGCKVTALEDDPALFAMAGSVLATEAPEVSLVSGPLAAGWPISAPYDLILIEGAVSEIPRALGSQVHAQTGRVMAVLCGAGRATQAVIGEPSGNGLSLAPIFDCGTPPIPVLRKAAVFAF